MRVGAARLTPEQVASLGEDAFMERFGSLYEHSPWVAEGAWARRPYEGAHALRAAFEATVREAPSERRIALIRSHPELAGREAREGALTAESAGEQASAGLDRLTAGERAELAEVNAAYRERFGFPMVVAVREHTKESIFRQARERLANSREQEIDTAVGEILKIGRLRLGELVSENEGEANVSSTASARSAAAAGRIVLGANNYGKGDVRVVKVVKHAGPPRGARPARGRRARGRLRSRPPGGRQHRAAGHRHDAQHVLRARQGAPHGRHRVLRARARQPLPGGGPERARRPRPDRRVPVGAHHRGRPLPPARLPPRGRRQPRRHGAWHGRRRDIRGGARGPVRAQEHGSGWEGFLREEYTSLPDTNDRIMATIVTASWTYARGGLDFDAVYAGVRDSILATFDDHYSPSVQLTLYRMGEAVLAAHPDVQRISFALPNKHHLLYDLGRFGMENQNEIFHATNEPYGLIEGTVERAA